MTKCIDCEHGPCYIHMTNNNWIELRKEYIHKFCNDHNGEVRWLRGIFMDDDDAIEEHLTFISNLLIQKDQEHKAELESIKGEILECTQNNNYTDDKLYNEARRQEYGNNIAIKQCISILDSHINKLSN